MSIQRSVKKTLKDVSHQATHLGHHVLAAANATYESVTDAVDDTQHAVGQLTKKTYGAVTNTVEDAVDASMQRIYQLAEERLERLAAEMQTRMLEAAYQRQQGLMLLGVSIACGMLSGVLLSFALVYCAVTLLHIPLWASFVGLCMLFAVLSVCCFQWSKPRLKIR